MRQDQVLLMADPHLVEGVSLGDDRRPLPSGCRVASPGMSPIGFQRDRHDGIVRMPVRHDVLLDPVGEALESSRASSTARRPPAARLSAGGAK